MKTELARRLNAHELSFWDGEWWCRCGNHWLKDDYDAQRHYNQIQDGIAQTMTIVAAELVAERGRVGIG